MSIWLSGFTKINGTKDGWGFRVPGPYRFVLHTTETDGLGLMPTNHPSPPHLWVDINRDIYLQGISLDLAGYALRHPAGTIETNGIPCVQIEIVGRAKDIHNYSNAWYTKLAQKVIGPVCDAIAIDYHNHLEFKGEGEGILASINSKVRMTENEWRHFEGVCGHQHVPHNSHWDPGKLNYAKIISILDGNEIQAPDPEPTFLPILSLGSQGDSVFSWQNELKHFAYSIKLDGDFGAKTKARTMDFQRDRHLIVDGIVGDQTWLESNKASRESWQRS